MKISNPGKTGKEQYVVYVHVLIGICFFYFLIHPLTMVMYSFEMNESPFTLARFFQILPGRIAEAFTFRMAGLSGAFVVLGGLAGLGSGFYYRNILRKTRILRKQDEQLKRNILSIIENGESDKVEFKSSLRYDYNGGNVNKALEEVVLKTIAGFLNASGGELLIGVADDGEILGLENDYATLRKKNRDGFELRIYQLISSSIGVEFCANIQITFYALDGKDICVVDVEASSNPAYVQANGKTPFHVRVGNSTKTLTIREAVKYISQRKNGT
ncbi:MAG: helix-turn-helix domain-containing protein [Saprospiraceae bacterium]